MKKYKLWIEIEEIEVVDGVETEYRDLCDAGEVEPVPMGVFADLPEAVQAAEARLYCCGDMNPKGWSR
jgi:hypothetical protein